MTTLGRVRDAVRLQKVEGEGRKGRLLWQRGRCRFELSRSRGALTATEGEERSQGGRRKMHTREEAAAHSWIQTHTHINIYIYICIDIYV
ncbi:hypothetical protein TGDOM2_397510 [Toxoplasma gondii GAB2-2007-GAL-DOM2]|uniref:Uncharacterized protein n=1 Tax=Toxoplasma gondii GAB2-2007-GAL-DOM2 TaxID=1130820 RepID=A0A086KXT6_TOXGO|nr:hypothetical protein TGDOM2_397510 [Toxoplasma gondii GAB2-2007-GAL-DOM2]